jgi:hypothetical protein
MTPEWATILRMHDQAIAVMFVSVCAFALNWYVFESKPAVQRMMTWFPLLLSVVIIALEIASGV